MDVCTVHVFNGKKSWQTLHSRFSSPWKVLTWLLREDLWLNFLSHCLHELSVECAWFLWAWSLVTAVKTFPHSAQGNDSLEWLWVWWHWSAFGVNWRPHSSQTRSFIITKSTWNLHILQKKKLLRSIPNKVPKWDVDPMEEGSSLSKNLFVKWLIDG